MKTYFETQPDRVTPAEIVLFRQVQSAVQQLPDHVVLGKGPDGQVVLSCHILARAVARVFGLKCVDGFFHPNFEHSWLLTVGGNVIDVYPVGMLGGPILSDRIHQSLDAALLRRHGRLALGLYIPSSARSISRGRFTKPWFRRAVAIMERHLRTTTLKLAA